MSFIDEFNKRENDLLKTASPKEIAFYNYVSGNPNKYSFNKEDAVIEDICKAAFSYDFPDKTHAVKLIKNQQPIKGLHYSNNFIDLCALGKYDYDLFAPELQTYYETAGSAYRFLISEIFPQKFKFEENNKSEIDNVVSRIIVGSDWNYPSIKILDLFSKVNDLILLFLLKKIYTKLIWQDTAQLLGFHKRLLFVIETVSIIFTSMALTAILTVFIIFLGAVLQQNWNTFEPWWFLISTAGFALFQSLLKIKFESHNILLSMIQQINELLGVLLFQLLGLDYKKVKQLVIKYSELR